METPALDEMKASLAASQAEYERLLDGVNEATLHARPLPNEWTMAENLVHMANARTFFVGETRRVLAEPGTRMGRTVDDVGRLQAIALHGGDSQAAIREAMQTTHATQMQLFNDLQPADLQVMGVHVKRGPQTLGAFVHHFLVEHNEAHVQQIKELLVVAGK